MSQVSDVESDVLCAIAVGQLTGQKRYQATKAVVEAGSFKVAESVLSRELRARAELILERTFELKLEVWPLTSRRYPHQLREISAPPPVLYVHSLITGQSIPAQSVGVVGTRSASVEDCVRTTEISGALARAGVTVVSGLALGIDGAAHRGALQSGIACPTVAVLAHGLDRVYPPTHVGLARDILDAGGLIVSEYAPGVEPMKHHFLARNRIIAGLSLGVVVVKAGARSGSLVTANFAADYGRDVFVVSDMFGDVQVQGGVALLEQGAIAISSAADVLREYNMNSMGDQGFAGDAWQSMSMESLLAVASLSPGEILRLELEGRLVRLPGNMVRVAQSVVQ